MVYLDYSATTPVNSEVLDSFNKACNIYPGNPNSLHKLGIDSKIMIDKATSQIANIMGVKEDEIIYTSGSSESNNLAIKGVCLLYQNRGKHIITTDLEHSSIYGPIDYLITLGFEVSYVKLNDEGKVDLVDKIRGKKTGIRRLTVLATEDCTKSDIFFICHADAFESAEQLSNGIKEKYPDAQVVINQVGPILGNNTGPGALAVIFYGANR